MYGVNRSEVATKEGCGRDSRLPRLASTVLALLVMGTASAGMATSECQPSLKLEPDPESLSTGYIDNPEEAFMIPPDAEAYVSVGMADVAGWEILIADEEDCLGEFRLEWQYETTVSILGEGPHIDLTDWKHFTSEWRTLEQDEGRFVLPALSPEQARRFPEVDMAELVERVREVAGDDWADHAAAATAPDDYPAAVLVNVYRVRLVRWESGAWLPVQTVTIEMALGC